MQKKKYLFVIAVIIIILFPFHAFCLDDNSKDLFENDIFSNIARSPMTYHNNSLYSVTERIPESNSYADRSGADLESIVKGDGMEIIYWRIFNVYKIHMVTITKKTDISFLGKYIGMSRSDLLTAFNSPESQSNVRIGYVSDDWEFFVNFQFEDDSISQIIFGRSI